MSVVICPHLSLEHYRGGEKWASELANRLAADGIDVAVRALPYAPGGKRRVTVQEVLDERVSYDEAWRHDLSGYDTAYVFYNPLSKLFFHGARFTIAGIHSWVYVSRKLYEPHYGTVPTVVKGLYRLFGVRELREFDAVHSVTPAYDSPHPTTVSIPNFVDTNRFRPDRAPLAEEFTVLSTAAHIPEKGWDTIQAIAASLQARVDAGRPDTGWTRTKPVASRQADTGSVGVGRTDGGRANGYPENDGCRLGRSGGSERAIRLVTTGESDCDAIEGLGFLDEDELAEAYARAHVVLHPARVDTDSMVINEACASGTPVVTTPIATHVRENDAVLHGRTVEELCAHIETLRREWYRRDGYDTRCRLARAEGEAHSVETIYPQLRRLLTAGPGAVNRTNARTGGIEPTKKETDKEDGEGGDVVAEAGTEPVGEKP